MSGSGSFQFQEEDNQRLTTQGLGWAGGGKEVLKTKRTTIFFSASVRFLIFFFPMWFGVFVPHSLEG